VTSAPLPRPPTMQALAEADTLRHGNARMLENARTKIEVLIR
jgi:hypothetical protein